MGAFTVILNISNTISYLFPTVFLCAIKSTRRILIGALCHFMSKSSPFLW
jgi:hypothetical protein